MRASLDQAMGTAHGLSHNADLGCYMEYNEQVIITLANEVKRLQAEIKLQNKDWCEDDEAIKQQALRVLDAAKVEGDSWSVPRGSALAEMMAYECELLRDQLSETRKENDQWEEAHDRLVAELAAAKTASVVPAQVVFCDWEYDTTVTVVLWSNADAQRFADWLRERMKERGEG